MSMHYDPNAYDFQAREYADFADKSFSWLHIERPALDEALAGYYERGDDVRVLDIGCGSGRVIKHMIERGIPAQNITGLDPSTDMLAIAAQELPQEVGLIAGNAAEMPFLKESFHLVVANMVLHAMDDQETEAAVDRIGEVLVPGGEFFFIDNNPRSDSAKNAWTTRRSPWGSRLNVFEHDMDALLYEIVPNHGLTCVRSKLLEVSEDGRSDDPAEYARYTAGNFRLAALLRKPEDSGKPGNGDEEPTD